LFLQEFDIKIKDRSGVLNHVFDHLSHTEGTTHSTVYPIVYLLTFCDDFPSDYFFSLYSMNFAPWFAEIANYLVTTIVPSNASTSQVDKLKSDVKYYAWDDPYL